MGLRRSFLSGVVILGISTLAAFVITAVILGQSVGAAVLASVVLVALMAALMRLMSRLRQLQPSQADTRYDSTYEERGETPDAGSAPLEEPAERERRDPSP